MKLTKAEQEMEDLQDRAHWAHRYEENQKYHALMASRKAALARSTQSGKPPSNTPALSDSPSDSKPNTSKPTPSGDGGSPTPSRP